MCNFLVRSNYPNGSGVGYNCVYGHIMSGVPIKSVNIGIKDRPHRHGSAGAVHRPNYISVSNCSIFLIAYLDPGVAAEAVP